MEKPSLESPSESIEVKEKAQEERILDLAPLQDEEVKSDEVIQFHLHHQTRSKAFLRQLITNMSNLMKKIQFMNL